MAEERITREKQFHDSRFGSGDTARLPAQKYYAVLNEMRNFYNTKTRELATEKKVLEFGCGLGSRAFDLSLVADSVIGIDISDVAIDAAQKEAIRRNSPAKFVGMNAEALQFETGSFDLIVGTGILHHLNLETAFRELARVLRADGTAVFCEPLGHNPVINLYRKLTPNMRSEDEHPLLRSDLNMARLLFKDVRITPFALTSLFALAIRKKRGFGRLLTRLQRFDDWLFSRSKLAGTLAWYVVIELRQPIR